MNIYYAYNIMAYAVVFGILGTLEQTDQYSMNLECANFGQIMTLPVFL